MSVRRWNQKLKRNYLQMAWNGRYQLHMFQKSPSTTGLIRIPENYAELMDAKDEENLDESDLG